jgi:GxxExxY protein
MAEKPAVYEPSDVLGTSKRSNLSYVVETIKVIARDIYQCLGSGYAENVYERAMHVGFQRENIKYESQKVVELKYEGFCVGEGYADLVVWSGEDKLVVELKVLAQSLSWGEKQQLKNYMNILSVRQGLLINFWKPGKTDKEPQFEDVALSSTNSNDQEAL